MSAPFITARPLVHARRQAIAAADNLSIALAYEGMPDPRFVQSLDDAETCARNVLAMIQKARGPVPPVPPAAAAVADAAVTHPSFFATACAITGAGQPCEAA